MKMDVMMYPNETMHVKMSIDDLKGYHLMNREGKYYEKGFISDFVINNVY